MSWFALSSIGPVDNTGSPTSDARTFPANYTALFRHLARREHSGGRDAAALARNLLLTPLGERLTRRQQQYPREIGETSGGQTLSNETQILYLTGIIQAQSTCAAPSDSDDIGDANVRGDNGGPL
jgi:hypothetical protein